MSTSVSARGRELVAAWDRVNRCVADWFDLLAEFDEAGAYLDDGFSTCSDWLIRFCGLGRSTAMEKVRVCHELQRRPIVRAAMAAGLVGYEKVRALTRLAGVDDERDAAFVEFARHESAPQLDYRVRVWNYRHAGDRRPPDVEDRYGLRVERGFMDGMGRLVIEAPNEDIEGLVSTLDAYLHYLDERRTIGPETPEESRTETPETSFVVAEVRPRSRSARRLDALFDLVEEVQLVDDDKIDPERAALGVTVQYEDLMAGTGSATTQYGSLISGEAARRLACDAGLHRIIVKGESEVIDVGRKTRHWNTAQRRAIRARHRHCCAFVDCPRRITHIHHIRWWENGGETSIDNGVPLCGFHHHLVHDAGWNVEWDPRRGRTRFLGPRGQLLESRAETRIARMAA